MPLMICVGVGGRQAALPTTDLYAQFDANDTANHTPASGIWTPSSGSDSTTLLAKNSGGTTQTFSYGINQNSLRTIDCPTTIEFRPSATDATTYNAWTILMAFNLISGGNLAAGEYGAGSAWRFLAGANTFDVGNGVQTNRINATGFSTPSWRVAGAVFDATEGRVVPLYSGGYTPDNLVSMDGVIAAGELRNSLTAYGGAMTVSGGATADMEIGEILIYSSSDVGQAIKAMEYLRERWGIS